MKQNVTAPSVGESITEVSILKWVKQTGEQVDSGELLLEIESDKATVEVVAETSGRLEVLKSEGEMVPVGEIIAQIDTSQKGEKSSKPTTVSPAPQSLPSQNKAVSHDKLSQMGPAARKMALEKGTDLSEVSGSGKGGRITKGDLLSKQAPALSPSPLPTERPGVRRVRMSGLRAKIAERLLTAQKNAAILSTFNEVDMAPVMELRKQHKEAFKAKHGISLGFMSFFTKAAVKALQEVPEVNAQMEGQEVLYHDYCDIGVAVGTDRGLVVPVLRNTEQMGFVEIEKTIVELATKARSGKLSISEMSGGTFTISNGGVYGSLLSTPILNPPQSGILGMHNIVERPVAREGRVEIRPMMYLALSYDHRLIDGKGAVTFLVILKELIEHPEKLNLEY